MGLKYAIIGVGALGGYYGGRLAQSGKDVHFLLHSDYEYVKQNGLQIKSVKGDFKLEKVNAYASAEQMPVCDVVMVCIKTTQNKILKDIIPHITGPKSVVILVQNGLNLEAELAAIFPNLNIAGGLAFICSSKTGKGQISHFDFGKLTIGCYQGDCEDTVKQVCDDLNNALVPAVFTENLNLSRWKKLVWNIPYNGMTVVANTSTDKLMKNEATRSLLRNMMKEVVTAARFCNADIPDQFIDTMLESTDKMTPYAPSMRLDFDNKRPLEIRAIYSNPIETARLAGYEMVRVQMLEQQLSFIQSEYLKEEK